MLEARVWTQITSFTSSQSSRPSRSSFRFLLFHSDILHSLLATPVVTAGGEPGWSGAAGRRRHRGPRARGDPAGEATPDACPRSLAPRPARPSTQCAVCWRWHWIDTIKHVSYFTEHQYTRHILQTGEETYLHRENLHI